MDVRNDSDWFNTLDAEISNEPLTLRDLPATTTYLYPDVFPQDEEHIYEPTIQGIIHPLNQKPTPKPRILSAPIPREQQRNTAEEQNLKPIVPPPLPPRILPKTQSSIHKSNLQTAPLLDSSECSHTPEGSTKSLSTLSSSISQLMSRHKHTDEHNTGLVWARLSHIHPAVLQQVEVTVSVAADWDVNQLPFPTPVNQKVNTLIDEVFNLLDLPRIPDGHYVLKLCDSEEYLHNDELLGMHEVIQTHCKFNSIVSMRLLHINDFRRSLARDAEDDRTPCQILQFLRPGCFFNVCRLSLQEVLGNFNKEVANFTHRQAGLNVHAIVGRVRTICNLLCGVSSQELEDAIGMINRVNPDPLCPEERSQCRDAPVLSRSSAHIQSTAPGPDPVLSRSSPHIQSGQAPVLSRSSPHIQSGQAPVLSRSTPHIQSTAPGLDPVLSLSSPHIQSTAPGPDPVLFPVKSSHSVYCPWSAPVLTFSPLPLVQIPVPCPVQSSHSVHCPWSRSSLVPSVLTFSHCPCPASSPHIQSTAPGPDPVLSRSSPHIQSTAPGPDPVLSRSSPHIQSTAPGPDPVLSRSSPHIQSTALSQLPVLVPVQSLTFSLVKLQSCPGPVLTFSLVKLQSCPGPVLTFSLVKLQSCPGPVLTFSLVKIQSCPGPVLTFSLVKIQSCPGPVHTFSPLPLVQLQSCLGPV
ncbi:hypothetical protein WMY93_022863 [Mugilogobius chulae]|uniref:PI3K-RBD domain-containing protein n=1 Tax=Mugilogobius chulae TaxID=88201 RepID=A0AAW0N726_9GOBI